MVMRFAIAALVVVLFALTGAKVGALWSLQQEIPTPVSPMIAETRYEPLEIPEETRQLLNHLNSRLIANLDDFEASLLKGLLLFQLGDVDTAIEVLRGLTERAPKFQLAHLLLGDMLTARFSHLDSIGALAAQGREDAERQRVEQLQKEARARLLGYLSRKGDERVPSALMVLGDNVAHALVVDKSKNRLYVYRNAGPGLPPQLVDDFYIVLGKRPGDKHREGDLKTPNGVYYVTSYLPDEKLPPMYGSGAFPVNYPNEYDRRLNKTGSGIWLHGTDKSLYSRPPLDSEGCVVLTNDEFSRIARFIDAKNTPVIISESVEWLSTRQWFDRNIELQSALETWRQHWEKAELDEYLSMYANDFWSKGYDSERWGRYKSRVFRGKTFQKIDLSGLSLLGYPPTSNHERMVVADFVQRYRSNNFNGDMHKRLYLVRENTDWKILYEGRR